MLIRKNTIALGVILTLGLSACGGGGGGGGGMPMTPNAPSQQSNGSNAATYTLSNVAENYNLPALGGYSGSLAFPSATVPAQTTMSLTSSLQAPLGANIADQIRRNASTGTANLYFFLTIRLSNTVSLPAVPGFTITIPYSIKTSGQQFFYAISTPQTSPGAIATFRTEGPAAVSDHTLTFAPSLVPLTIEGGVQYVIALYSTSPVLASQGLWVANGTNVLEFVPADLPLGFISPEPNLTNNSSVFGAPQGVVFDALGDLWVIDGGTVSTGGTVSPALDEFTPEQLSNLKSYPAPKPNIVIKYTGFTFPQQAVFDAGGNLWVSDNGSNAVFKFTRAQLAVGGSNVMPTATILSNPAFTGPLGIAFAPNGNLWIANNGTTTIFAFDASMLPSTGTVTLKPNVVLSNDGSGSIEGPWALVFDTYGDLWSSNANAPNTVVEFSKGQLQTGSPVPIVTISPTTLKGQLTLSSPNGLAFDNVGDLAAVSSVTPFGIPIYGKTQLSHSGAIIPDVFIVGTPTTLSAPAGDVFGPAH